MLIYGVLLSPFVRKACVAAAEKGLDYELKRPRDQGEPTAEFLGASPFGKMPAIRDGDFTLADSSAIVAYLEVMYPAPALLPADPRARGLAVWFDEYADTIIFPAGVKILFNRLVGPKFFNVPGDEDAAKQGEAELVPIYAYLERVAPKHGWLAGEHFSMADIAVASMLRSLAYCSPQACAETHPATAAWFARVCERPAWKRVAEQEAAMAEQMGLTVPELA